jgi:hypothetical protein
MGGVAGATLDAWLNRNGLKSREILLEQLADGSLEHWEIAPEDDLLSALWRYQRATIEGAARKNLKLLARAIVRPQPHEFIYASEFHQYANSVQDLSHLEIEFLAAMFRHRDLHDVDFTRFLDAVSNDCIPRVVPDRVTYIGIIASLLRTGLIYKGAFWNDDGGTFKLTPAFSRVSAIAGGWVDL